MAGTEPYVTVYHSARSYYQARRPEWTKAHIDVAARRKMVKMFLSHLWVEWRRAAGLPVREPYVAEKLGHTGIIAPPQGGDHAPDPDAQA